MHKTIQQAGAVADELFDKHSGVFLLGTPLVALLAAVTSGAGLFGLAVGTTIVAGLGCLLSNFATKQRYGFNGVSHLITALFTIPTMGVLAGVLFVQAAVTGSALMVASVLVALGAAVGGVVVQVKREPGDF